MSAPTSDACACKQDRHDTQLVVVTGGPGAGKTAVLEMARRSLCEHVIVLPEAAGIVFGGGFPRHVTEPGRRAAQRAIFHVQREMERLHLAEATAAIVLCDRGTLDGIAYWPGPPNELLDEVGVRMTDELSRYRAVVHLRTPDARSGYDRSNPLRVESAEEAQRIDERILDAWSTHDDRAVVTAGPDFRTKADEALSAIGRLLPSCCRRLSASGDG